MSALPRYNGHRLLLKIHDCCSVTMASYRSIIADMCLSAGIFGKPQTGSFVTGSFRQALATRSSSARQTFVSTVFVFAIARQTLAKRLSKTTRLECTCLGLPDISLVEYGMAMSRVRKQSSEAEICREIPEVPQQGRYSPNFRLQTF